MRRHALNDVEKPMVGGELNQFDAIGGSHFIENAREVRFDRVLAGSYQVSGGGQLPQRVDGAPTRGAQPEQQNVGP